MLRSSRSSPGAHCAGAIGHGERTFSLIARAAGDLHAGSLKRSLDPSAVGGYWTRTNDPEIDLVGADRAPIAKHITMVGSIKWPEDKPFDARDLSRLIIHRSQLPGADEATPLLAVARAGCTAEGVPALGPEDLLNGWR